MNDDLLDLYGALAAPCGARLVSNHGALALVVVDHPHPDSVCITRYPFGPACDLDELLKLVAHLGLDGQTAAADPGPALSPVADPTPRSPAPDGRVACPECGTPCTPGSGLAVHRKRRHGVESPYGHRQAAKGAGVPCPDCGRSFTRRGLENHRSYAHRVPEPAPLTGPAQRGPASARAQPEGRGTCAICGTPWAEHVRCAGCGIGIGPGHGDERAAGFDGLKPLCGDCLRARRRQGAAISAAAD